MLEMIILGRGGQGAQTAGNLLARAFSAQGRYVQAFSTYGGARRGTPVMSSLRVDEKRVRQRCNITKADALLCFDASLLEAAFLDQSAEDALVVVNTGSSAQALNIPGDRRVVCVDGKAIARRNNMGKVVNSALLGGFCAALGQPDIETLARIIEDTAPAKKRQNVAACREAYELLAPVAQEG
ncbi:2-oxoacid:acceptor oxidoreductase family protein [Sulfitobacter sp. JB4-11]|uniref:2-oxoacid:acceptor oxidoreductase family protein n=1 Tax=Sulfitobacter rhodophyticola TaxID=3238304 RepID=UPI0035163A71